jgi:hypothetical protein
MKGEGRDEPLAGARAGDRFALAMISLTLDEVDADRLLTSTTTAFAFAGMRLRSRYTLVATSATGSVATRPRALLDAHRGTVGICVLLCARHPHCSPH